MQKHTMPSEAPESELPSPAVVELGDAVELTEGTSSRSGTEDKRYKYQ